MNILRLNELAISRPLSTKELDVRVYINALSYMDGSKTISKASEETPVYRLCKDYSLNGLNFALNLIITDNDAGKAETFMDNAAEKITKEQLTDRPFAWTGVVYTVKKSKKGDK